MHQSVWEVLGEYGVCSLLLRAIQYLYNRWKSLAGNKLDSFPVCVGLCQSWPLSPIQFIFMDRISRRSKAAEGFNFGDFRNSPLLFADNVVLFASSGGGLQLPLGWFEAENQDLQIWGQIMVLSEVESPLRVRYELMLKWGCLSISWYHSRLKGDRSWKWTDGLGSQLQ